MQVMARGNFRFSRNAQLFYKKSKRIATTIRIISWYFRFFHDNYKILTLVD